MILHVPVHELLHWQFSLLTIGILATFPLLGVLVWLVKTSWQPVTTVRKFIDEIVRPVLGNFTTFQLLILSILAGVCEEFLFRAFLQTWLSGMIGPLAGIILASAVFGAGHLVTWFYGIFATVLGIYMGALMLYSESVWPPIIAHTLYDFIALIWLLKINNGE